MSSLYDILESILSTLPPPPHQDENPLCNFRYNLKNLNATPFFPQPLNYKLERRFSLQFYGKRKKQVNYVKLAKINTDKLTA